MKNPASILKYFIGSEILIILFAMLLMYGILSFLHPIEFAFFGGIFYAMVILFTGVNIIIMVSVPREWKNFFWNIGFHIRNFLSLFVPGITISKRELDEANNSKRGEFK